MRFLKRLFPGKEVQIALDSISELERKLPSNSLGLQLGFGVIKAELRNEIVNKPEDLKLALKTTTHSIPVLVLILARNIVLDELETGSYSAYAGRSFTMAGDGLIALHRYLTDLLQKTGGETAEEAAKARASLREGMQTRRFG
jgi:hypothetical protein